MYPLVKALGNGVLFHVASIECRGSASKSRYPRSSKTVRNRAGRPIRSRADRSHQSKAGRQADHAEGAARRRQRGRPEGGIAPERGRRRAKQGKLAKKPRKASPGQKEMLMSLEGEKPKVRPRRSRRRSHSDGPFRNRAVPRSLGSAQHWGGLHGYERSLGNDRSVRSCGRQGPPQESFPNDVGKGNGFSSLCDGLGRPVAEGNDRRAVALALGGLFIWSLGRS
jgi:hypothetical protein